MTAQPLPEKILMTADTLGGIWTYAMELANALQKYDVQIHLATMGKPLSYSQWMEANKRPNLTIEESDFALEWMQNPWKEVDEAGEWLLELEQKIQPDLIHLNNYSHGALPWDAPVLMIGHSCVLSWWQAVKNEQASQYESYALRVKKGLQSADFVASVTQCMLDYLNRYYGPFTSSGVIYNGRDASQFIPQKKEPIILSMGRLWDEAKNISSLKAIAGQLPWPVYVAGSDRGWLSTHFPNLKPLGMLNGHQVSNWLAKTSIYVMPARYEPFGLSVLEAALSGCALILGDIPSLREVWEDAALYADPEDPSSLQEQITHLIDHPERRQKMADKARKQADKFSLTQFEQQYVSLYQQLLKDKQPNFA